MTLSYLFTQRERPTLLTARWFIVWLKRTLLLSSLARILFRRELLKLRGARIGQLAIVDKCRFEGPLGRFSLGEGSAIGRDCQIALHDRVDIGDRVVINNNVIILTASHGLRDPSWRSYGRPVTIESYAWVATGAIILPGVTIGKGAVVGAGAVVRQNVPPFSVVAGNPAEVLEGSARTEDLEYLPTRFAAAFEAWLGRP